MIREIKPNIYVNYSESGLNSGAIVTREGAVLVDLPPFSDEAIRWLEMAADLSGRPPRYLILTDGRIERTVQAARFPGPVIMQAAAATALLYQGNRYPPGLLHPLITRRPEFSRDLLAAPPIKPAITFDHEISLKVGEASIQITHAGGPSTGSVLVRPQGMQVTFTGDIVVADTHPLLGEGLTISWLETLNRLRQQEFEAEVLVPGRGGIGGQLLVEPVIAFLRRARSLAWGWLREEIPAGQRPVLLDELVEMFPYQPSSRTLLREQLQASLEHLHNEIQFEVTSH